MKQLTRKIRTTFIASAVFALGLTGVSFTNFNEDTVQGLLMIDCSADKNKSGFNAANIGRCTSDQLTIAFHTAGTSTA